VEARRGRSRCDAGSRCVGGNHRGEGGQGSGDAGGLPVNDGVGVAGAGCSDVVDKAVADGDPDLARGVALEAAVEEDLRIGVFGTTRARLLESLGTANFGVGASTTASELGLALRDVSSGEVGSAHQSFGSSLQLTLPGCPHGSRRVGACAYARSGRPPRRRRVPSRP